MLRVRPLALALAVSGLGLARVASADGPATRLLKGPYVSAFTDSTADLRFELDAPAAASIQIVRERAGSTPPRKIADPTVSSMHVVHVTGLEAGKPYGYGILVAGQALGRGTFTTATADMSAPVHFIAFGDERSDTAAHAGVVRAIASLHPDFLVNTGDMVAEGGAADEWATYFQIEAPLLRITPMLVSIGNHELTTDEAGSNFARYWGYPSPVGPPKLYGSARVGMARFFFLNAMHDWSSGDERQWLEQALTQADHEQGLVWRVAVIHHGPWSSGPHGGNQRLLDAKVPELLAAHHVDLIISGHDHIYERGDSGPFKYVISGGGGAPLYQIASTLAPTTRKAESVYHYVDFTLTPSDLKLVAHRVDGSVIERCGFLIGRPWSCQSMAPSQPAPMTAPAEPMPPATASAQPSAPAPSSRCTVAAPGAAGPEGPPLGLAMAALAALLGGRRRRGC